MRLVPSLSHTRCPVTTEADSLLFLFFPPFLPRFGVHGAMSFWTPCSIMSLEHAGVKPRSTPSPRRKSGRGGGGAVFRGTSCSFLGCRGLLFGGDGGAMLGRGPEARSGPFACLRIHTGGDSAGLDLSDQRQSSAHRPTLGTGSPPSSQPCVTREGGRGGRRSAPKGSTEMAEPSLHAWGPGVAEQPATGGHETGLGRAACLQHQCVI